MTSPPSPGKFILAHLLELDHLSLFVSPQCIQVIGPGLHKGLALLQILRLVVNALYAAVDMGKLRLDDMGLETHFMKGRAGCMSDSTFRLEPS